MQLGNLLRRQGGIPITGRSVKFKFIRWDKDGTRFIDDAEAVLLPVDEKQRAEIRAASREYVDAVDDAGERLHPDADFDDEVAYRFLLRGLRDGDDVRKPFATDAELPPFRKGLVQQQVAWLGREYDELLRSEYPELIMRRDVETVKGQALGFTDGDPAPR